VDEAVLVVALGKLDRLHGRGDRDAAALGLWHDHPADLIDCSSRHSLVQKPTEPRLAPLATSTISNMRSPPSRRS